MNSRWLGRPPAVSRPRCARKVGQTSVSKRGLETASVPVVLGTLLCELRDHFLAARTPLVRPTRVTNAPWLPSLRKPNESLSNSPLRRGTVVLSNLQRSLDRCQFGLAATRFGCIIFSKLESTATRIGLFHLTQQPHTALATPFRRNPTCHRHAQLVQLPP